MPDPLTWPALRAKLAERPGWKRRGSEWHGPCPLGHGGTDTCWFGPGTRAAIRAGCRRCGTRLGGTLFARHLRAVTGEAYVPPSAVQPPQPAFEPAVDPLPDNVWAATVPLAQAHPGFSYLADERRVIDRIHPVPRSVRWIDRRRAAAVECRPQLPAGAAGALVYRYCGPSEPDTRAVQLEAVGFDGRRIAFPRAGKRPSVLGSWSGRGRRVFVADDGKSGSGCWLVEGPLDALAVVRLGRLGLLDLDDAAVFGAAGVPGGFRPRACWNPGPVTVAPDSDPAGQRAAVALAVELAVAERPYRIHTPGAGTDWSALACIAALEREAIADA